MGGAPDFGLRQGRVPGAARAVRGDLAKAVRLCLRRGNTGESAVPYMVFGDLPGRRARPLPDRLRLRRLSLALVERFRNRKQRAEVHFVVGYFGTSWLRPATEAEELWRTARAAGRETGDLFHTGCACAGIAQSQLMRGVRLDEVLGEAESHLEWLERARQREPAGCLHAVRQTVRSLRGRPRVAPRSTARLPRGSLRRRARALRLAPLRSLLLRGQDAGALPVKEYEQAHAMAVRAAGYLKDSKGMLHGAEHVFYDGLIQAAGPARPARGPLRPCDSPRAQLLRRWASLCPANFGHKHRLLRGRSLAPAGRHGRGARPLRRGRRPAASMATGRSKPSPTSGRRHFSSATRRRGQRRSIREAAAGVSDWGASAIAQAVGRR